MRVVRLFLLASVALLAQGAGRAPQPAEAARMLSRLPLRFEANQGQTNARVKYLARGPEYTIFLTPTEAVLSPLAAPAGKRGRSNRPGVVRMSFRGANRQPALAGERALPSSSNYFRGNNKERWLAGVQHFEGVRYRDLYPGIDLIYYASGNALEYDFIVAPGADPSRIRLRFSGAEDMRVDSDGSLLIRSGGKLLRQKKPVVYQERAAAHGRELVDARYVIHGSSEVTFSLGAYDRSEPLVIDPVLTYATYLGGPGNDVATAVAADAEGSIYITGHTTSIEFPVLGDPVSLEWRGSRDIFLVKLTPSGEDNYFFVYSSYIGGMGEDQPWAIALDQFGNVYVAGETGSGDFPIAGNTPRTTAAGEKDAFVFKLNPRDPGRDALQFSTFLGGTRSDHARALTVDQSGRIHLAGYTRSLDFPLSGDSLQKSNRGGWDIFYAQMDSSSPAQEVIRYTTYLGGEATDVATAIVLDQAGKVYLAGYTVSWNFPATGGSLRDFYSGNGDAFLTRLDLTRPGLDALDYSTLLGGGDLDIAYSLAMNKAGRFVLAGYTLSNDFPVTNTAWQQGRAGNADGFVTILDLNLSGAESLYYSTYIGGNDTDVIYAMAPEADGTIAVTGYTVSRDFPLAGQPLQSAYGGGAADVFFARINPDAEPGISLVYSTYLGDRQTEAAYGLALGPDGEVHLVGFTQSDSFPVSAAAHKSSLDGLSDAFVIKVTK